MCGACCRRTMSGKLICSRHLVLSIFISRLLLRPLLDRDEDIPRVIASSEHLLSPLLRLERVGKTRKLKLTRDEIALESCGGRRRKSLAEPHEALEATFEDAFDWLSRASARKEIISLASSPILTFSSSQNTERKPATAYALQCQAIRQERAFICHLDKSTFCMEAKIKHDSSE